MDIAFLRLDEVIAIHHDQIQRYGGMAGIRDLDLLKSALAVPQATMNGEFLHADIFDMAAAYLFHIVRNHPFADGNKRTGLVAALVFLELNGIRAEVENDAVAELVERAAAGEAAKTEIAEFLRRSGRA